MGLSNLNTVNIIQKIDKQAIESVKEAIFKRAESKNSGVETTAQQGVTNNGNRYNTGIYSKEVRNEVMTQAVNRPSANPFASGVFGTAKEIEAPKAAAASVNAPVKRINTASKISNSMVLQTALYNSAVRESAMVQAQESMIKNNDLMSRLQFLNTQTAINTYPSKRF